MNKTYKFTFKIDTTEYAKRFGIEIPDDASDIISGEPCERGDVSNKVEAQDAAISYGGQAATYYDPEDPSYVSTNGKKCKTPLEKCEAENPLTCRFHGVKAISNDIEATFKKFGLNGDVNVHIYDIARAENGHQIMSCTASISAKEEDADKVKDAMREFFSNPGVSGDIEDIGFDPGASKEYETPFEMDILNPNATAKWGAREPKPGKTQPEPSGVSPSESSPTTAPGDEPASATTIQTKEKNSKKSHQQSRKGRIRDGMIAFKFPEEFKTDTKGNDEGYPELFPEEEGGYGVYTQEELNFLQGVSEDIEKMARRINERIDKGSTPDGTKALKRFDNIDKKTLLQLADKDSVGLVKGLVDIYDRIRASESGGWADRVLAEKWDPNKESSLYADGTMGELDFKDFRFDCNKYGNPKPTGSSSSAQEENAKRILMEDDDANHKRIAQELLDSLSEMSNIKKSLDSIQPLKAIKPLYDKMRHKLGVGFYKANESVKKLQPLCEKFADSLGVMKSTIAKTKESIKAKGQHLVALDRWQDVEDIYEDEAWRHIARHFSFPVSEKKKYMAVFKRNMAAAAKKCTCFTLQGDDFVKKVLSQDIDKTTKKPIKFHGNILSYVTAMNAVHGCSVIRGDETSRQHVHVYACTCDKSPADIDEWYSGNSNWKGSAVGVVVKNNNCIKGIYNGCCSTKHNLMHHTNGSNVSFMNDCNCTALMRDVSNISKDAFTKDLSDLPANDLWTKIGMTQQDPSAYRMISTTTASNETWIIGGVGIDQISELKFFHGVPSFTKEQKDNIRKYGIIIRDVTGQQVKI